MALVSEATEKMHRMDWAALKSALEQNIKGITVAHLELLEKQAFDGETLADTDQLELERWGVPGGIAKRVIKWRDSVLGKGEELRVLCSSLLPLFHLVAPYLGLFPFLCGC
jgi:hypothetical protein